MQTVWDIEICENETANNDSNKDEENTPANSIVNRKEDQ